MPLSELIERLGRTIFEAPFSGAQLSTDQPELAEIRLALLDEIKSKSHRVAGRYVFPHNVVRVQLLGVPEAQAAAFLGDFFPHYFEQELRSGLTRANYRFPTDLRVELRTTPRMPAPRETWIQVETETIAPAPSEPDPQTRRPAKLVVVRGKASQTELVLKKTRTNIGRTVEITRLDQGAVSVHKHPGPDLVLSLLDPIKARLQDIDAGGLARAKPPGGAGDRLVVIGKELHRSPFRADEAGPGLVPGWNLWRKRCTN